MPIFRFVPDPRASPPALATLAARYARSPRGVRDNAIPTHGDRWSPVPATLDAAIAADAELARTARAARAGLVAELASRFSFRQKLLDAILAIPRERFVLPEDIAASADDTPMQLDRDGHATVSAPHAYLLTFNLLDLAEGDHLLELGTGTGYGAALARYLVGPRGHVTSIEIDPILHERAARLLAPPPAPEEAASPDHDRAAGVTLLHGDGRALAEQILSAPPGADPERRAIPLKIAVTYALPATPSALEQLLPEGARLVAPVGRADETQELVRVERRAGKLQRQTHGAVRYVPERSSSC